MKLYKCWSCGNSGEYETPEEAYEAGFIFVEQYRTEDTYWGGVLIKSPEGNCICEECFEKQGKEKQRGANQC